MPFPSPENWKPGIYFGLPEDLYHSLPWLGSGDIKTLASIPQDFWDASAMNPLRDLSEEGDDTAAKLFGRAIHDCILHGEPRYLKKYGTVEGDSGKESISAEGLKDWIRGQGAEPKKLKADNERYIRETWGMELVTERQNKQILMAARSIKSNPYLVPAFSGGFPEVSIFWIDAKTGAPCKCRIDYLKIGASVDLKSIRKQTGFLSFRQMCIKAIYQTYRYDIQAAHYTDGRLAAKALLDEGAVWWADAPGQGGLRPSDEWLAKCFGNEKPGWVFVFYKANGAPIARSFQCGFGGWMMTSGMSMARLGRANYADFMEKFGTNVWVDASEPDDMDSEDSSKWWAL